jgi:hypothetical protein
MDRFVSCLTSILILYKFFKLLERRALYRVLRWWAQPLFLRLHRPRFTTLSSKRVLGAPNWRWESPLERCMSLKIRFPYLLECYSAVRAPLQSSPIEILTEGSGYNVLGNYPGPRPGCKAEDAHRRCPLRQYETLCPGIRTVFKDKPL